MALIWTQPLLVCDQDAETAERLVQGCERAGAFWGDSHHGGFSRLPNLPILSKENVLRGIWVKESSHDWIVNTLIIVGNA